MIKIAADIISLVKCLLAALIPLLVYNVLNADTDAEKFTTSLKKWKNDGIINYTIKVNYRAFSPVSGLWEIEVNEGRVVSFRFNGTTAASYKKTAESFTMDSIYKRAEDAQNAASDSAMKTVIEYCGNTGYIQIIKRINNPSFNKRGMRDAGYSIEVIELIPLK